MWASEFTWILSGVENYLRLVCVSEITRFLFRGIELDLISKRGSNWLDFSSGVEINLISVWGFHFDLVLVSESSVACFLCGGPKLTLCGPKLTYFECDGRLICFFVWVVVAIELGFGCGPQIAWFWSGWSILTWYQFRDRNWFVLCLGIENDLVLVSGSESTLILCDDGLPQILLTDVLVMF